MAVLGPVTSRVTGKLMGAGMEDMSEVHGNDSPWEPEIRDWALITGRGGGGGYKMGKSGAQTSLGPPSRQV